MAIGDWLVKRISALTRTATNADLTDSEYMAVDNASAYTRKITVASLATWILGKIKSLATSITAFRTGDVIPVDGPNGPAKMGYSNLAKEVIKDSANNTAATESDLVAGSKLPIMTANGPKSLPGNTIAKASEQAALTTYAQNVAHSIAPEYDPTRDYVVGDSCTYGGTAYIFTSNHPAGAWNPAHTTISGQNALLQLTAQNALAGNVAPAFDPTRDESNPYKKDESVIYQGELYVFTAAHYGDWTGTDAVKIDIQKLIVPLFEKLSTTELKKIPGQEDIEEIKILTEENEIVLLLQKDKLQVKSVEAFNGTAFEKLWPGSVSGRRTIDSDSIIITGENYNFVALLDKDGVHAKEYFIRETLNGNDEPLNVEESVEIVLPAKFTAVVGDTLQLFYRGVVKHPNPYIWALNFNCSVGKNTPRFYEVTPTANDVGNKTLTMFAKTKDNKVVGTASATLKIVAKPSSPGSAKKILCFGDSLTSGGVWCAEAYRRLTGSDGTPEGLGLTNIDFCGRQTKNGAGYFGIGGWSWSDYTTAGRRAIRFQVTGVGTLSYGAVYTNNGHNYTIIENNTTEGTGNILCSVDYGSSYVPDSTMTLTKSSGSGDATITYTSYSEDSQNPLWDYSENKMTFVPYANEVSNGQIDVVYTLLTWNGLTGYKTDFTDIMAKVKTFADTLHSEFPSAKLKILGIQIPSVNGGVGASYGASGNYGDWYGLQVTAMNMSKAYKAFAESDGYSSFVEFVNVAAEFDSEWNMPRTEAKVNTRSSQTEVRGTNGVHPSEAGYLQIGDVVYRNLCEFLQ